MTMSPDDSRYLSGLGGSSVQNGTEVQSSLPWLMSVVRRNLSPSEPSMRAEVVHPYCGGLQTAPTLLLAHPGGNWLTLPAPQSIRPSTATSALQTSDVPCPDRRALRRG